MPRLLRAARLLGLALLAVPAQASLLYNDGLTHVVSTDLGDALVLRNEGCSDPTGPCASPGDPTTAHLQSGAIVRDTLDHEVSEIRDSSSLLLDGGTLGYTVLYDQSTISITGGQLPDGLALRGQSTGFMSGSFLNNSSLVLYDSAQYFMTAGHFDFLSVNGSARIRMEGGQFEEQVGVGDDGVLVLVGYDFTLDGVPVGLGPVSATSGDLAGSWFGGGGFSSGYGFTRTGNGQILLVPEPSTASLLLVGLAGIASVGRRRVPAPPPARATRGVASASRTST